VGYRSLTVYWAISL